MDNRPYCSNCKIYFVDSESHKNHFKTEFHRYNIKRRLVNLEPISQEDYDKRKNTASEKQQQLIPKVQANSNFGCKICNKTFQSKQTYESHLESKKHIQMAKKEVQPKQQTMTEEKIKEKKVIVTTDQDQNSCLFCNLVSDSLEINLEHMLKKHSFFISAQEQCIDKQGLLKYLGEKVQKGLLCLECNNEGTKGFNSAAALQDHMLDKGHCFMNSESYEEYEHYYDFTPQLQHLHQYCQQFNSQQDDDWQDEEQEEQQTITNRKTRIYRSNYLIKKAQVLDTGEVLLPNGKTLGNRMYQRFYKQFIRDNYNQHQRELRKRVTQSLNFSEHQQLQVHKHLVDTLVIKRNNIKEQTAKLVQNQTMQKKYKRAILAKGIQQNRILYLTHNWRRQYGV